MVVNVHMALHVQYDGHHDIYSQEYATPHHVMLLAPERDACPGHLSYYFYYYNVC